MNKETKNKIDWAGKQLKYELNTDIPQEKFCKCGKKCKFQKCPTCWKALIERLKIVNQIAPQTF